LIPCLHPGRGPSRLLFCLGEPRHEPVAAPKLNIVTVNKALRLLDCHDLVGANQRFEPYKMPVVSDCICPVLCHARLPTIGGEHRPRADFQSRSQNLCGVCSVPDSIIDGTKMRPRVNPDTRHRPEQRRPFPFTESHLARDVEARLRVPRSTPDCARRNNRRTPCSGKNARPHERADHRCARRAPSRAVTRKTQTSPLQCARSFRPWHGRS
jgi:hypothetical protein